MKKQKRILAFLIAFSIFSSTFFGMFSTVMAMVSYAYTAETNLNETDFHPGDELAQGSYYLSSDLTFDGSSTGNGLKIASGDTVVIYLNGHTLTAIGKNGTDGSNGGNGSTAGYSVGSTANGGNGGSEAGAGAYAGILLPASSTLIFVGEGTVNAIGGNAGKGGIGGNGADGRIHESPDTATAGSGGGGGQGGGGAAAGIGTNGGNGANGGKGGNGFTTEAELGTCYGSSNNGNNGSDSGTTSNAGKLLVYSNNSNLSSIVMNLTGGSAPTSNSNGGSVGISYYDKGTGWHNAYTATSGAGGGAGGNGYAAPGYGAGSVGGAGGAGGASGTTHVENGSDNWWFIYGYAGTGGKGSMNGKTGTGANASEYWSKVHGSSSSGSPSSNRTSMNGSQKMGGSVGEKGTEVGYTTYYMNGLYARISAKSGDNLVTYKSGDYISKDDVDVYAIYSTDSGDVVSDTIGRIELVDDSSDGFSDAMTISKSNSSRRAYNVGKDYWSFEVSDNLSGDHLINGDEIISITDTNTTTPKAGKVNVQLNINMFAYCSSFVRDYRIAMDTQQTLNKEDGTDATVQASIDGYTASGEGANYNAEKAIKVIDYDNKTHTIAELIKDSNYGINSGELDITDDFFKNGLNTDASDESAYWYNEYAQTPYYRVEYKPYRPFVDYDATNVEVVSGNVAKTENNLTYATDNYLTGSASPAITVGDAVTGKYAENANSEYGAYVSNGDTDTYFAAGQIDKGLIKNAGEYTVTVVVPYRYFTYDYTGSEEWFGDTVSTTNYSYFFRTYTFNIIVRKTDLAIKEATDTVYENTKVQSHMYNRYVEAQNGEEVYGTYTYASAYGEEWGNSEDRTVNENHKSYTDIEWEFNIYEDEYMNPSSKMIDGQKNMNNYLCQVDGASAEVQATTSKDIQNTYYKGDDGVLIYTNSNIATRDALMVSKVSYEKDQKEANVDNEKTISEDLDFEIIGSESTDISLKSIYAEDVEFEAAVVSDGLGWRVVKGDSVTGTKAAGTKIEGASDLAEGYNNDEYYGKFISSDKYNGDFYAITVKASGETVKYVEYFDDTAENTVTNIKSTLTKQVMDDLPACEYYGVDAYDVTIEYVGLYYTAETAPSGRNADWDGTEEFNWVTSKIEFKLDVEPREVSVKPLTDVDKIYDGTAYVVSQTLSGDDVTGAGKYVINLNKDNTSNTQFAKLPGIALYNYIDPTDDTSNSMDIELAGTYSDKNKGADKSVTISEARWVSGDEVTASGDSIIPVSGDKVASLNYVIVDGNGEVDGIANLSGDISVAQMHFSHILSGTVIVREYTPLHEIFEISNKAYLLTLKTEDKTNFVKEATMTLTELVEKDDAKSATNNSFNTNSGDYDYDAKYVINESALYKQYIKGSTLVINNDTGSIDEVATVTKGGTNPVNFPAMDVSLVDYSNFHVVPEVETVDTDVYNVCSVSGTNDCTTSDETLKHIIRFRIIGNNNNYDLILPINQINNRLVESKFLKRTGEEISVDSERFNYVAVYPNDSDVEFEFTIPQDSYLEDVAIIAIPDYKTYDTTATFKTLDELTALAKAGTGLIGTFETQSDENGMNNIDNPIYMTLDTVNGAVATTTTSIDAPNDQIGGSTFKFTLATGDCDLGENYAIAIVPLTAEYDKNLLADDVEEAYATNLSVEQAVSGDGTLVDAENDCVYVNYKTLFDTTADGIVTLSYEGAEDLVLLLPANSMNEFNSFAINTEANATFFNPSTLVPGTVVNGTIEVWRNGVIDSKQESGDNDAFDTATFTWTISKEEYENIFDDDVVTVVTSGDVTDTNGTVLGYFFSKDEAMNKISVFVTNHKTDMYTEDKEWTVQTDFDLLSTYIDGVYNIDGTKMTINEDYTVESLALGMTIYPFKLCMMTFDSNGGSEVTSQEIIKGKTAIKPENPTYGDLHFIGWFVNPNLDNIYYYELDDSGEVILSTIRYNTFDFGTPITEDIELTALWVAQLQANTTGGGQISNAEESGEIVFDDEYPITSIVDNVIFGLNNTVKLGAKEDEGYLFVKWTKDGVDYSTDKVITVIVTEDAEFIAVFKEIEYTVSYDANGGTGTMNDETTKYYIFPDCGFTAPSGKIFDKWDVNGTKYEAGDMLTLTEDITVKAIWKNKTTGSSGGGGGSSTTTYKITTKTSSNGTITPDNPSVIKNDDQKFKFSAKDGYEIEDVLVDGVSVGAVESYTLENVKAKHTIELKVKEAKVEDVIIEENNAWSNASEWAIEELRSAEEKELIPETFANKDFTKPITRKDFTAVAVKLYEAITGTKVEINIGNPFTDTDDEYVIKAYQLGITLGTSETTFTPDMEITREQMATMLTRALAKAGINVTVDEELISKFADDGEMHDWGRNAVYFMANNEIIKGIGDNKFGPLGNATIEQSLAIALRSVNVFAK